MVDFDAISESESTPEQASGEALPAYAELVSRLADAGNKATSSGPVADWRDTDGGKIAVVLGDAGVGSLGTLYGAISASVQVDDRHLYRWRERIQVSGHPLEPNEFAAAMGGDDIEGAAQTAIYAAATRMATNGTIVLNAEETSTFWGDPLSADIVLIANGDHAERLGEQLSAVLSESSAVFMAPQRESIADAVRAAVDQFGASLHEVAGECKLGKIRERVDGQTFTIERSIGAGRVRFDIELPAAGAHQRTNFATALLAARETKPQQIAMGLKTLWMPLRFESIKTSPRVIVDGAASRPAYRALVRAATAVLDSRGPLVLANVDSASNPGSLSEAISDLSNEARVAYQVSDRAVANELAERLRRRRVGVQLAGAPGPALNQMMSEAEPKDTVLTFGSRRATSEARAYILGLEMDPR